MRTFPKELAEFRELVNARGATLRELSSEELVAAAERPTETVVVQGRQATVSIIVQPQSSGSLRVVVQGFMPARIAWLGVSSVALDGFYKRPDGAVEAMPDEEFYEFD